jgi:hypothetical protein
VASDKAVFLRPIVVTSTNKDFVFNSGADALTTGTYPNVASVAYELATQCTGVTATFSSDFKVVLTKADNFTLDWTDTALRDLLGFTGNLAGNKVYTATYTPQYCWFPSRVRADNNRWQDDSKIYWKGKESLSGNVAGLVTGASIYRTTIEYEALNDYECLMSRCHSTAEQTRCLEYFMRYSRGAYGTYSDVSPAGFYFFPDYTAVTVGNSATYTSGNATQFHYTSSPTTFAFCHFDADWYPRFKPTIKTSQTDWWDVDVEVHTATAPTWSGA